MHEEVFERGVLTGHETHLPGQGPDPMDAVLAVSQPRDAANETADPEAREREQADAAFAQASPQEDAPAEYRGEEGGGAPEYGEFSWPDGYAADPGVMARFLPLARRIGLSQEAAQELASLYADLDRDRHRAQAEFVAKNNAEWIHEIESHPEFGGANLRRTGEDVASMFRRYGSPLLTAQIRQMNIQNWPEMFYFLARVSQAVSEDSSPGGHGGAMTKSTAQLLFPGLK